MRTHNVVLSDRQEAMIADLIQTGEFRNADEVMQEGLRLVEAIRVREADKEDLLRAAVRVGLDDLNEDRFTALADAGEIAKHLRFLGERAVVQTTATRSSDKQ